MKILSLSTVPLLPHLGSGKTRLAWTNGLKELNHEVKVLQPADFEFLPSIKKAKQYRHAIGVFLKVRKLLKNNHYDLIEFYGDQYWLLLIWLKRIKRSSPVMVAHVDGIELHDMDKEQAFWNKRKGLKKWAYRNTFYRFAELTFSLADKYVCGCDSDLQYAIDKQLFDRKQASCISPGIDDAYHDLPFSAEKEKIIVFVGSWIQRKGIKIIPTVITEVLFANPDYQFHIYGAWHDKQTILSQFAKEVQGQVIVFDKVSAEILLAGISRAAIFFFPSYSEGFGLATVEAMSCSCAVVTTPTGIGSNLTTGKDALICNFNDAEKMTASINTLINDESFRREVAYNGFKRAKEFIWDQQVKKLAFIYQSWLYQ